MTRRLTHLNGMRAFEAAARHMSFAKAAEELGVTPAAVSQQIKTLEAYLGIALFKRTPRALFLTPAAEAILPQAREGFDLIAAALSRARSEKTRKHLAVSTTPSFAAKWLMPRLEGFIARNPGIEIRLDATTRLVDFEREDVDIAVRYGNGRWAGAIEAQLLMREEVFPVCSPSLVGGRKPLRAVADLRNHPLIHDDSLPGSDAFLGWVAWLEAMGAPGVDASHGLHVNASMFAIQAALEGKGIALARSALVADDVASGRLCRPFKEALPLRSAYYVVHRKRQAKDGNVAHFRRWLLAEPKVSASKS